MSTIYTLVLQQAPLFSADPSLADHWRHRNGRALRQVEDSKIQDVTVLQLALTAINDVKAFDTRHVRSMYALSLGISRRRT